MASRYDGEKHNVKLSKALSWLLRHNAENQGLKLDDGGFVDVDDVLRLNRFKDYSEDQIRHVVRLNDKQRFLLREHPETKRLQIRANQGHSIKVDLNLREITDPSEFPKAIHGTNFKALEQIRSTGGLSRMTRNHIHFSRGEVGEAGVISGMRSDCDVYIYVDLPRAMKDGYRFYESTNKVILCPGNDRGFLPTDYFAKIVERKTGKELSQA